jgi:hypothetical protein
MMSGPKMLSKSSNAKRSLAAWTDPLADDT